MGCMTEDVRVVSASRVIDAPAAVLFELIADPARQREWDGNENLAEAARANGFMPWVTCS